MEIKCLQCGDGNPNYLLQNYLNECCCMNCFLKAVHFVNATQSEFYWKQIAADTAKGYRNRRYGDWLPVNITTTNGGN